MDGISCSGGGWMGSSSEKRGSVEMTAPGSAAGSFMCAYSSD